MEKSNDELRKSMVILMKVYVSMFNHDERNVKITADVLKTGRFEDVAANYGITKERVRQIVVGELKRFCRQLEDTHLEMVAVSKMRIEAEYKKILSYIGIGRIIKECDKEFADKITIDCPLEKAGLSVRLHNVLLTMGVHTIGDLMQHTWEEYRNKPSFGKKCEYELNSFLERMGLSLTDGESVKALQRGYQEADTFMVSIEETKKVVEGAVNDLRTKGKGRKEALKFLKNRFNDYIEIELSKLV